jgi:uncharacterized membrane protein
VYAIAAGHNRGMMQPLLTVHIAAGSIALASMLVPMLTTKGGRTHRRAGWVFVASMALVSVTALIMSAGRVLSTRGLKQRPSGASCSSSHC